MWPFSWFRRRAARSSAPRSPGLELPPDAVFFGGFGDVVQMQAYFGAFAGQGPTDASLDAAFMRIETLVWSYEPFPHEERIYTEVAKQHAAGHAPLHAEAGGLLQDAHRAVDAHSRRGGL